MKAQCNLRVERVGGLVRQLTTKAVDPALAPGHRLGRPATRVLAAAPTKEAEIEMFEAATRTQTSTEEVAHSAPGTSGRIVLEGEDELRSTWEHRLWVGATTGLLAGTFANGLSHVTGPADAAWAAGAAFLAYVLSDLGTGIYHWAVDK